MNRTYIDDQLQKYLSNPKTIHLWQIASHADILANLKPNGTVSPIQKGEILIWLAQNGFITTPNSQLSPEAQQIEAIAETARQRGIRIDQIASALDEIEELDDGTKEFWQEHDDLLEAIADWDIGYSDMGYSDPPQF